MAKNSGRLSVAFLYDDSLDKSDGVAQYVKKLGGWLAQRGHRVTYLTGESKISNWHGGRVYSLARNLPVAWAGNRLSFSLLPKLGQIKKIVAAERFDVVHVQMPYSPFMSRPLINRINDTTALVGTVHIYPAGRLSWFGSKILRLLYGKSFRRFDEVVSVSSAAQAYAKQAWQLETEVIPNPVEFLEPEVANKIDHTLRIVFVGRLVERKGCTELIKAFKLLIDELPEARLTIAGDGPQRAQLERLAKRLGLAKQIEFLGFVSEQRKASLLAGASVACFPALYGESFGIVLIEAMAAGAVVLGGDNPGYRSVLGASARQLVEPKDTGVFAERLKLLLSDKDLRAKLIKWQSSEIQKYSLPVVGEQILALYRRAIAKREHKLHN